MSELVQAVKQAQEPKISSHNNKSDLNEALYEALRFVRPSLSTIQHLITAGAEVNAQLEQFNNQTPLHNLCFFCQDVSLFKYLLATTKTQDAISVRDNDGVTPFHNCFNRLLQLNHKSNDQSNLPSEYYTNYYKNQEQVIMFVVNRVTNIDANMRDYQGKTVLHYLVNSQSIVPNDNKFAPVSYIRPLVNFLMERGASLNARDNNGCSPILSLIEATPGRNTFENKNAVLILKGLLMCGADITLPDYHGNTPLLTALKLKSFKVAQILLHQIQNSYNNDYTSARNTSRALLNTKYMSYTNNDSVGTILHHLLYEYGSDCSVEAIKLLIDAGMNVSQDSELGTPLFMATWGGNLQFLKTLIEYTHESESNRGAANGASGDAVAGTGNEKQVTIGSGAPQTPSQKKAAAAAASSKQSKKSSNKFFGSRKKKEQDTLSDTSSNTASILDDPSSNYADLDPEQYHIDVNAYSTVNDSIKAYFGGIEDCLAPVDKATPLHAAIAMGRTKVVQYLLSVGADVKAEALISPQYRSSAQRSSFTIVEILRDAMARGVISDSDAVIILDAFSEREKDYMRTILDQYPIKDKRKSLVDSGSRYHEKKITELNGRLF
jgi:ankyrin repeat protein